MHHVVVKQSEQAMHAEQKSSQQTGEWIKTGFSMQ